MNINWLKKISNKKYHDAFTDLSRLDNHLLLCFRRATDHHSNDGKVVLQRLSLQGKLISQDEFKLKNSDLRDPKIYILENNKLLLAAFAGKTELDELGNEKKSGQNTYWYCGDDLHWQHQGFFGKPLHWCWRLSWHKQRIFSLAYEPKAESLHLYTGADLSTLKAYPNPVLSKAEHNLGYPNESDLYFVDEPAGTHAIAIVRRDADTYSTQLGNSVAPFMHWQWQDLPLYLASPRLMSFNATNFVIAARYQHTELTSLTQQQKHTIQYFGSGKEKQDYINGELKTGLFTLNKQTQQLTFLLPLPSADDNGYPGVVIDRKGLNEIGLWISYYSTPEIGKTQVYVAYLANDKQPSDADS
jgi:hypothetical protein